MARYGTDHKEATRRRLIATAGRRFKSDGFDGSGISTLVADAGLTNGAFYGHFASKDDLIANVVAEQLAAQTARIAALPAGLASVEAFVGAYLSPAHRDDVAGGCPSAALLDEITRCDEAARQAYTDGARTLIAAVARLLDFGDEQDANARAVGLFALLVASLQAARAVTDSDLSDRILVASHANAMTLATAPFPPSSSQDQDSK
ncbi:probable transcriptional regulator [Janibacter sp. HTCC2649]|uniref:TetR/AcrR family transcriptional regulator n=1 Tax=Janibacter sp. HTCC2649 TaxID=313589 RepID=UPI000066F618|nr:TetR/AcrR family transcriptional regulator [Janibacter sp. HTCC2649]EAP96979.1 probable transcriptional regulator [Janibacter sp. HTCC2649]